MKAEEMTSARLAAWIDQSVLKPEFTESEIRRYILEGVKFGCKTVCIHASALEIAHELTAGSETGICVVCDFPFGTSTTASKCAQARLYAAAGYVTELDLVANYGWIRSGRWDDVTEDIRAVTEICHEKNVLVKVIFETDVLTEEEIRRSCECAIEAGADFVKTSTGFVSGVEAKGATVDVIRIMMDQCRGRIKIKSSGGIRSREHFLKLIDMGIDRMGVGYRSTPVVLGLE